MVRAVVEPCLVVAAAGTARAQTVQSAYDPSPSHPFGRPHPDAPVELAQFAFMIGAFDCTDRISASTRSRSARA